MFFQIFVNIFHNKCFLWRNLCWVWKKKQHNINFVFILLNCLRILKIFYDWHIKYYFWWFWYMITRLKGLVRLSIYFTRALFHKYIVTMKYRWICIFFILSNSPSLMLSCVFVGMEVLWMFFSYLLYNFDQVFEHGSTSRLVGDHSCGQVT